MTPRASPSGEQGIGGRYVKPRAPQASGQGLGDHIVLQWLK